MNIKLQDNPALILIDIEKGFDDITYWGGNRNNPEAEAKAEMLLYVWRENFLPVFHVKHCSTNPASRLAEGSPGNDFKEIAAPLYNEPIIKKTVNSAFIGTDLQERLEQMQIKKVVIAGLTTDHCVSTTTRMAGNLGFEAFVVADATATFDKKGPDGRLYPADLLHHTALVSLHQEFATVISTQQLLNLLNVK